MILIIFSVLSIYLEGTSHLASSLENILDHVLASGPHLVTLLQEVLAEAHPVDLVRVEGGCLEQRLTAIISPSNSEAKPSGESPCC